MGNPRTGLVGEQWKRSLQANAAAAFAKDAPPTQDRQEELDCLYRKIGPLGDDGSVLPLG
ncbi:MAG: hypothetical protein NTX45_29670 [Proteobacteria bacterium]|nr:hypothetical protein [Pseudomonadota bacterium]